jgi:hypothetical protein
LLRQRDHQVSIAANSEGPGMLRDNTGAQLHRCMIQERRMGEWKTIYDDEVEGRFVTLKV